MFIYIAGIIGFITFIYYSCCIWIKVTYKDIVAMLTIVLFPLVISLINLYNIVLFIMFIIISTLILYLYTKKLKVKTRVILIGCTILKYALYSTLIASIIYKCLFDFILKYNYKLKILYSGYFIMNISIFIISIKVFIIIYCIFINKRIKNKYIHLNKQYKYCIYTIINYCIDNILIVYLSKWIFTSQNNIQIIKYILVYTIISELIIQNILIKSELSYTKYKFEVAINQLENQIEHYCEYEKYIKKVRYIIHDIKNHKILLKQLLASKKYKVAMNFLNDLEIEIEDNDYYFITENVLMEAIIKNKIKICKVYGINFNYNICIPRDINIRNVHMSVIFNNLIDNAIEACLNIDELEKEKYINLYCEVIDNKLICVIKNSKNRKELKLDKNFKIKTLKKDKTNHGIGIENLKLTIEKYDGIIDFNLEEHCFTVKFVIPI